MKRVSFKVAKAIKKAGYLQGQGDYAYRSNGKIYIFEDMFDHIPDYCCDAPTHLEVWLWLWREKDIKIELSVLSSGKVCSLNPYSPVEEYDDPEEAIIMMIEYLVDNNLIK